MKNKNDNEDLVKIPSLELILTVIYAGTLALSLSADYLEKNDVPQKTREAAIKLVRDTLSCKPGI